MSFKMKKGNKWESYLPQSAPISPHRFEAEETVELIFPAGTHALFCPPQTARERKTGRELPSLPPSSCLLETKSQRTVRPDPPRLRPFPDTSCTYLLRAPHAPCSFTSCDKRRCYHNYCWISVSSKKQSPTGDFSGKTEVITWKNGKNWQNEVYLEAFYFGFNDVL